MILYGGKRRSLEEYLSKCKELALYDTGINAEYGDKLLTLPPANTPPLNGGLWLWRRRYPDRSAKLLGKEVLYGEDKDQRCGQGYD